MLVSGKKLAASTYAGVLILVLVWIAGIVSEPLIRAAGGVDSALLSLLVRVYGRVCHQIGDRSFHIAGHPLAVCARCFGVYVGYMAGLIVYPFTRSLAQTELPPRSWLIAALVPVVVDFAGGFLGIFENTPASRALTGLIAGTAGAFYTLPGLVSLAASLFKQDPNDCGAGDESKNVAQGGAVQA
jgi:uncharacterized membrane protein